MTGHPPRRIAVVGSGPAGCFTAQALHRRWPEAELTVFDRLAAPYGLVRYGVAPDHQHGKAVARQFDRLFADGVRFAGDVELGGVLPLETLRAQYDLVVLATGLDRDRALPLPGAQLPGVVPAGRIVAALNAAPRPPVPMPAIGPRAVVIGAGNVAVDIVRLLAKTEREHAGGDVDPDALASYLARPAAEVTLLSRSSAVSAKADPAMLRELGGIPGVAFEFVEADPAPAPPQDPTAARRLAALAELAALPAPERPRLRVRLLFGASPERILGEDAVRGVRLADPPAGWPAEIHADTVVTAIGFEADPDACGGGLELAPSPSGRMGERLYRTGWLKRGPVGAVPANRADAAEVVREIVEDAEAGLLAPRDRARGFAGLPEEVRRRAVSFEQWRRVDAVERAAAAPDRVRRKIREHGAMLAVARG